MPQYVRQKGATDQTVLVRAYVASTGLPKTGLVFNTSGLVCYYRRGPTGTVTQLTLATQTNGGAHTDGGFVEVSTNMPGAYRLDLADAVVATGADWVEILLSGVADTVFEPIRIDLLARDPYGATVDANIAQISGDATAADNLEAVLDGTGGVTLAATLGANAIPATALAADAIGAAQLAAGAADKVRDAVWNLADAEEAAVPAANASFRDKLNWLFALARNKLLQTATTQTLRNDGDTGTIGTAAVSDDGTTFTRGKFS